MKTTVKILRRLIVDELNEGVISDYISTLGPKASKEDQIESAFPDALASLENELWSNRLADFEPFSPFSNSGADLDAGVQREALMDNVDFIVTQPSGKLIARLFVYPQSVECEWDAARKVWVDTTTKQDFSDSPDNSDTSIDKSQLPCPDCEGTGEWIGLNQTHKCKTCGGTGKLAEARALLRQLVVEVVRGHVDPEIKYDWSRNRKWWRQFDDLEFSDEHIVDEPTDRPDSGSSESRGDDCVYCSGSGMRDVGERTIKCDVCSGTGKI